MFGKASAAGLAADSELIPSGPIGRSMVSRSVPVRSLEPPGELREDRVDQPFVTGEPPPVFRRFGCFPETAAVVEFHGQEVAEQHGITRFGRIAKEVFDPRPIARSPGGLEPIARLVDVAADLGRIEPVLSP